MAIRSDFVVEMKIITKNFINGTTFDELYALYCFDRELRSIIFKYTLQIENTLRTLISYVFSKYHGVEN